MKPKKIEKKLELKKITIANLINQDMQMVRGGCTITTTTSSDFLGTIFPLGCSTIDCG